MIVILLAAWFYTKAILENTFLESTARIQSDRKQTVCVTGPYKKAVKTFHQREN